MMIPPSMMEQSYLTLEETGDISLAQALAGHSDPKTTANYNRCEIKEMRKAAGSLHFPLAEE